MNANDRKTNSRNADAVLALPSPDALQSRQKRSQIILLSFSCVLITGLIVHFGQAA